MRQALTLALRHTMTRGAFGTPIADRPMMTNVLADMAVEVEACTLMALRVARATDGMRDSEHERLLAAWPRRPPSTSTARARRRSPMRRCNAMAAMASSRRTRWPASTAKRR